MKVNMVWAKQSDGSKIHIKNNAVVRHNNKDSEGNYKYKCFCHDFPILAVKGEVNGQHFRHENDSLDNIQLYKQKLQAYNETIVHKLGKKVFAELSHLELPNNSIQEEKDFYTNYHFKNDIIGKMFKINPLPIIQSYNFIAFPEESKVETQINSISIIPDVQIKLFNSELMEIPLNVSVEILVSHALDQEKINKYKFIDMACIQVDLSDFLSTVDQSLDIDLEPLIKEYIKKADIYDYPYLKVLDKLQAVKDSFNKLYELQLLEFNNTLLARKTLFIKYSFINSKPILLDIKKPELNYYCPICDLQLEIYNNQFIHKLNNCKVFSLNEIETQKLLFNKLSDYIHTCFEKYSDWNLKDSVCLYSEKIYLKLTANYKKYTIKYDYSINTVYEYLELPEKLIQYFEYFLNNEVSLIIKEEERQYRIIESNILFALDSNQNITYVESANNESDYICLCCNQPVRKINKEYFQHTARNYECAIFNSKNALDILIPKILEMLELKLFSRNFNNQNYLVKLEYFKMPRDKEMHIVSYFSHSNRFSVKNYISNSYMQLKHLIDKINNNESSDFIDCIWYNIEEGIKTSILPNETEKLEWYNEISRFNKVSDFFKTGINSFSDNESFCPLCCGKIKKGMHLNRSSTCHIVNDNDEDFEKYFSLLPSIRKLYDFLLVLKNSNQKYPMTSWVNFFKSYGINVEHLKFKIKSVYLNNLSDKKENIEFWINIEGRSFLCGIGLTSKNKFYKDLYFKLNNFNKSDLKYPLDVSSKLYNYLRSIV